MLSAQIVILYVLKWYVSCNVILNHGGFSMDENSDVSMSVDEMSAFHETKLNELKF